MKKLKHLVGHITGANLRRRVRELENEQKALEATVINLRFRLEK